MAKYKGTPLESDYEALQRRRAITKALLGQAVSPYEQQMVSGYAVPAWGEAIGKIAQGYAAGKFGKQADEEEKALSDRYDEGTAAAMDKVIEAMTGRGAVGELGPQQPIAPDPKRAALMAAADPYLASNKSAQAALLNQTGWRGQGRASSKVIYDDEGYMYSFNIRTEQNEPILDANGEHMRDPRYTPEARRNIKYAEGAGAGEAKLVYQPLTDYQSRANELAAEMGEPPPFVFAGRQQTAAPPSAAPAGTIPAGEQPVAETPAGLPSKADVAANVLEAEKEVERKANLRADQPKRESTLAASGFKTKMLDETIDQALDQTGAWTSGFLGSATGWIPGTPAHNLAKTLETLKANIGFDKLQEMRANSPTGGALGNVSDTENRLLQAVWSSLEGSQSPEQLKQNLERVRQQVHESWQRINDAYMRDYGVPYRGVTMPDESASAPAGGYDDADKERRYQEWKAKRKSKQR